MHFQLNNNGNSASDMEDALRWAMQASQNLENAMRSLHINVLHGRNYQTVEDGEKLLQDDRNLLGIYLKEIDQMKEWILNAQIRLLDQSP